MDMIEENKTADYYKGVIHGLTQFAHWRGGIQEVGTCGTKLSSAVEDINEIAKRSKNVQL